MGYNCVIAVVAGATPADLEAQGSVAESATITGETALSSPFTGVGVTRRDGKMVLLNRDMALAGSAGTLAELGDTCVATFGSVSDVYSWEVYAAGEHRHWVVIEGETQLDEGDPHPAEREVAQLNEDTLFQLLEQASGLAFADMLTWSDLQPMTLQEETW